MQTRVAAALAGTPAEAGPSAASATMLKAMGMMVTEISMITVPATNGVMTLRSKDRCDARANWNSDETTTKVASSPGPPSASAVTDTAIKTPDVPMRRT